MEHKSYVLITPARNEEAFIEKTIQSVISQTVLPKKWVIVSDGSTDRTDEIVKKYLPDHPWIELIRMPEHRDRSFAAKATCFNAGYQTVKNFKYDIIGNLDADITFEHNYYENILTEYCENAKLGIAGGMVLELRGEKFRTLNYNLNSVAGAIQLFTKKCFEEIGGYIPLKMGGIDAVAEIMARMHSWEVRSFKDITVYHHRCIGTTNENIFYSRFRYGIRDYSFGTHPLFMFLKYLDRLRNKPYIIGSLLMLSGYLWAWTRREKRPVSDAVVKYVQREQMDRIISAFNNQRRK